MKTLAISCENGQSTTAAATVETIQSMIVSVRGVQVMLDRDLAELYGVDVRRLNEQVNRNIDRFPERFMHQLTDKEFADLKSQIATSSSDSHLSHLKSQIATSSWGGVRKPPKVFTEQGISMLSAVLRSPTAVEVSIRIMDAFVAMRKILSTVAPTLASLATQLDRAERRQISDQSRNDERFDQIFAKMSEGDVPLAQIFYQGKFWDAKSLLIKFIRRAKKELIVVDAYVDVATLDMLAKRGRGVKIELVSHSNGELAETDFEAFGKQCGNFTKTLCGICHDRFIIVDQKEIFWTGASLKDAGRLTFAAAMMGEEMIPGLLESIRNAASERKEYGKGKAIK